MWAGQGVACDSCVLSNLVAHVVVDVEDGVGLPVAVLDEAEGAPKKCEYTQIKCMGGFNTYMLSVEPGGEHDRLEVEYSKGNSSVGRGGVEWKSTPY